MRIGIMHRYPLKQIKETNASINFLIDRIKKEGHTVDVLTFKKFDRVNSYLKFWKGLFWIFYAPILLIGKKYDVLYLDDSMPFYGAFVKLVSPKSKVVLRIGDFHLMYYYSGWAYKFLHFFEKIGWLLADEIVAISEAMAEKICEEVKPHKVSVVLDPVDPNDFPMAGAGDGSVMFHGTITRNKNLDLLIEAAYLLPKVDFVIIGDGPDLKRLKKFAPDNVFFDGWIPFKDVWKKISKCSIGVALRSDNPGNEYVVTSPFIQYGIIGKPCLVTKRKVFGNYHWQFSTARQMADKIEDLLTAEIDSKGLRELFIRRHGAEKIAEEIWALLQA